MEEIRLDGKVFIFLDHQKLVNEAFKVEGEKKYQLCSAIFEYHPKKVVDKQIGEDISKKRRRKVKNQSLQDSSDNVQLTAAITALRSFLPSVGHQNIERFWEQTSPDDFPKFKGANTTSSFQLIENFVKDVSFIVPPYSRFYNYDIAELAGLIEHGKLSLPYDLIVLDPPWRNKYIRRLKRHQLGYNMLECAELQNIPIKKIICESSVVAIWCTNSKQHQEALLMELLPAWNLRLLHEINWLKLNTFGEPISQLNNLTDYNGKQPYEMCYIACHIDAVPNFCPKLKEIEMIMSVPSIIHSHKPPLTWLIPFMGLSENPNCLELFARYLMPNFTSVGKEVLKLMDSRLYNGPFPST